MDETLFPATILTNGWDEDDGTDEDADTDEDKDMDKHSSVDNDEDFYMEEVDWDTLYMDKTDGIFKEIVNAVGKQSAKILHDFSITAWACSIKPEIVLDVQVHMTGYHRNAIETCIRQLLAHDIDWEENGEIDLKVDQF